MSTGILILGMHRSGTSALAGCLHGLGVSLGPDLLPGQEQENPRGYFEHAGITSSHDALLADAGLAWDSMHGPSDGWLRSRAAAPSRAAIRDNVARLAAAPLWAVKDPRVCRLLPIWDDLLGDLSVDIRYLFVHRPCAEVAASLAARDGFSAEKSALLWIDHILSSESGTRGRTRHGLRFDDLLQEPIEQLQLAGDALGLTMPNSPESVRSKIEAFLSPALRHHSGADGPDFGQFQDIATDLQVLLAQPDALHSDKSAREFDRLSEAFQQIRRSFNPLLLEFTRSARGTESLSRIRRELQERTEWLHIQNAEIERLRNQAAAIHKAQEEDSRDLRARLRKLDQEVETQRLELSSLQEKMRSLAIPRTLLRGWHFGKGLLKAGTRSGERLADAARRSARQIASHRPVSAQRLQRIHLPRPTDPRVSVIIPMYGQLEHTVRCLESVAAADGSTSAEYIVVDDASAQHRTRLLETVPNLRYIRNPENVGFIDSCHRGADIAQGEFLCFLNNDTEVEAGWLDDLCRTFQDFPDAGLVGAKLVYPNGKLQEAGGIVWKDGSAWNYGWGMDPDSPQCNYARAVDYCSGACIVVPRDLFESLGRFDARYRPAYYEDVDLAFRVREAGRRVYYQPAVRILHHEGITSGTDTSSGAKQYQTRNAVRFQERWSETLSTHRVNGEQPELEKERHVNRRVLVVDHRLPTPEQDAGSRRMFRLMEILRGMDYKVTFYPDNLACTQPYARDLQRVGVEVLHAPFVQSLEQHLARHGQAYDVVIVSRYPVAESHLETCRRLCPQALLAFDTVDLHFLREMRQAELQGDAALVAAAEQTRRGELTAAARSDVSIVVSAEERQRLLDLDPTLDVHVIPTIHAVRSEVPPFDDREGILFVGGFEHPPNGDAVRWFVTEVLPLIQERIPEVRFDVVGSRPTPEILALNSDRVRVVGYVEDLEPALGRARLSVAPLRFGAGVKGKVIQSLAHGLPCVATPIACEGANLRDGTEVRIAEDAVSFANAVVDLYSDRPQWERISSAGRRSIEDRFSFDVARQAIERMLAGTTVGA